ncbi:MAG: tetratricopeptide repeat protein [Dehalococcoidales bacterium]|nr:MAG: tetratricopeptide repeat protein [Dehalococcoidales bacterium]
MTKEYTPIFNPEIPPDLEHASLIREEALDWLETSYGGAMSFSTGEVLRMAGESGRRWLIARLRAHNVGNEAEFSVPDTADALAVLFLRSKGVKFRDAVEAVVGKEGPSVSEPRYGGLWNRLIRSNLERLRRRIPPRLLSSIVGSILPDSSYHSNCLIIVRQLEKIKKDTGSEIVERVNQDYAYRRVIERPAPICAVIAPSREVLFLARDQLPVWSEVVSRNFVCLRISTEAQHYEVLLGTITPVSVRPEQVNIQLIGRILDIVFIHFETFLKHQSSSRHETTVEPEAGPTSDLQLWLVAQFLSTLYPDSLCEISEISIMERVSKVLASSAARPWELTPWEPTKNFEMFSGYSSLTGTPLVVEKVEYPITLAIVSIEPELRFLKSRSQQTMSSKVFSAVALPITSSSGNSIGSLYMLMKRLDRDLISTEVRTLAVFARIAGEIIERERTATYSAQVAEEIVTTTILQEDQFKANVQELVHQKANEINERLQNNQDIRLPFLLLSAYDPDPEEFDPAISRPLRDWLIRTLRHIEWHSFLRVHLGRIINFGTKSFIGEVPEVGMMLSLGELVAKDDLDRIRSAFPAVINQTSLSNVPVKLVAWVLDVPAQRILDAFNNQKIPELANEIVYWASEVTSLVDDVAQSQLLAHEEGEWDAALHKIRQALNKPGGSSNAYLRRLAADCCFSLGDWPGALKYSLEAVKLSGQELGSGLVRSLCLRGDAYLCVGKPLEAWDSYTEASTLSPNHPLPRYYRGYSLLLISRLLEAYELEYWRSNIMNTDIPEQIQSRLNILVSAAMEDLTTAADLLDHWGLIPETYQYRNFHLVPTFLGQGQAYLLNSLPGPAASRLQSARRSFQKEDIFFLEFRFAKCWEQ